MCLNFWETTIVKTGCLETYGKFNTEKTTLHKKTVWICSELWFLVEILKPIVSKELKDPWSVLWFVYHVWQDTSTAQ